MFRAELYLCLGGKGALGDEVFGGPDGAKIFVDKKSLLFLNGTVLDYDTNLISQGFVFSNPNAKSTCGCGSSFCAEVSPPPTPTPTLQACRECGAGAALDAHFCPQCRTILPLPRR